MKPNTFRYRLSLDETQKLWDRFTRDRRPGELQFFKWVNSNIPWPLTFYGTIVGIPPRIYVRTADEQALVTFKLTWL